ncbi:hypothetical protein QAD02_016857 [Eretmocerus hayati]|uniref:Uncharacterized protein n=1 Tax=Eretmocerus hayati TaxID=131215 RepID=A0ACC2PBS2_9HYME|nr:hypothetical protein QAD02_016857 [Eretmocerus hayati]
MDKELQANSRQPVPPGCYRAYEGLKLQPTANNGNNSTLKRPHHQVGNNISVGHSVGMDQMGPGGAPGSMGNGGKGGGQVRCLCFGGVPDKASRHSFFKGFLINLAICAILVLYTLLGSFIFLYIEGSAELPHQRILATTIPGGGGFGHSSRRNASWLNQINEARAQTVQNLWVTTEKLNILYHENWTRLASEEIARFQEQVVKTLGDNLGRLQNSVTHTSNDDVTGRKMVNYEWNFARAFLYSLTVLTTIGESIFFHHILIR